MKIEININRNILSNLQISDLLQDLNQLTEKQLRDILKGNIHNIEIGEKGFEGGITEGNIKIVNN